MMSHLRRSLAVVDTILTLFVFFPLCLFHWRGTWELQDDYLIPSDELRSNWISFLAGSAVGILGSLLLPEIEKCLKPENKVSYWIVSRLYLYINSWAVMCYWRGTWNLLDLYLGDTWINSTVIYVICQILSFLTLTCRTNVGVPLSVQVDTEPDLLQPDTHFKCKPSRLLDFILDVFFTQFVIVTSTIATWRGIWNILDTFLFPHDQLLSDLVCLGAGYAIFIFLFLFQYPTGLLSIKLEEHSKYLKIIFEDFIMVIATWANLLIWRGGWDLCLHYVLPNHLGDWVSHIVGTVGLLLLQTFSNVALNGIEKDGQYDKDEGIYPTSYLRVYLQTKDEIKYAKVDDEPVELEEMATEKSFVQFGVPNSTQL